MAAVRVPEGLRGRRDPRVIAYGLTCGALLLGAPSLVSASPWPPVGLRLEPAAEAEVPDGGEAAATSVEDPLKAAQEAYHEGSQAYALGHFAEAVIAFERSYSLAERPELLYNIGQSYAEWYAQSEEVSHLRKARTLFQNYVKFLQGEGREQAEIDEAEAAVAEVEALLADATAQGPVVGPVEDPPPDPDPAPDPIIEAPVEPSPGTSDEPEKRPLHRRGWFWGVLIGGVLVVAGGVTAGVLLTRDPGINPELGTIRAQSMPMDQSALFRF